jgi:hypothetical protein
MSRNISVDVGKLGRRVTYSAEMCQRRLYHETACLRVLRSFWARLGGHRSVEGCSRSAERVSSCAISIRAVDGVSQNGVPANLTI